ncbi:hypothetical protein [Alienimonas californiensis]|uniref:Uncharacterized protein n=1 Tax=Alienimonas californiensis TaxID=2527989 RepID=A0A517PA59_9PLAN|nr:hypothetical protein [Alienimonas californiensis]QDT16257.1 hypothetical protein CA12_23580 [Alienimonas californiensis]
MSALIDAPTVAPPPIFPVTTASRDRRRDDSGPQGGSERRQFGSSQDSGRPEVDELAAAVDRYKLENRRRFITYAELYDVVTSLGYERP